MPSSDVLARVHKLLALAGSPNVHEAASAAAAAQALITRHQLEALLAAESAASNPEDPITDGREAPLEIVRRLRRWRWVLAAELARANGCVAYTDRVGEDTRLLLAGRAADRQAVAAMWDGLARRLEWLSATHGPGRPRLWHEAFRIGAAEVIVARLLAAGDAEVAALPATALVRVAPLRAARAEALTAFTERFLRLGSGRTLRVDRGGLTSGRKAGAVVPLG